MAGTFTYQSTAACSLRQGIFRSCTLYYLARRKLNFTDVALQAYRNYVIDFRTEYAEIINLTSTVKPAHIDLLYGWKGSYWICVQLDLDAVRYAV